MRILLALAITACGTDNHASGPYVAIGDLDDAYQSALCQHLTACGDYADESQCANAQIRSLSLDLRLLDYAKKSQLRYNGNIAAACFAAVAASSCDPSELANRHPIEQCLTNAFSGALHANAACTANLQCLSGACTSCSGELDCCTGTCVGDAPLSPKTTPRIGDPCDTATGFDPCPLAAYCDLSLNMCTAVKSVNQVCITTNQCDDHLECDVQISNSCQPSPVLGQPCTQNGYCPAEGTFCAANNICTPVGLLGDPCTNQARCSPAFYCDTTQHCAFYPHLGEPCPQFECSDRDNYCDTTTMLCALRLADSAACTMSSSCKSGFCDLSTGTCGALPLCQQFPD